MNHSLKQFLIILAGLAIVAAGAAVAADVVMPDLQKVAQGKGATTAKKTAVRWDKGKAALFTNGVIWLNEVKFTDGTIECDILGKSTPRGSNFPGVVFHGVDDATFESVYFRPFNFRAENPENAAHAVQYVAMPEWPWQKLRSEKTGQYEKPIAPAPDGDAWFHARIVIEGKKVSVFVNEAAQPSLVVDRLSNQGGTRIGISGGDAGEGGHFANLKITPKTH
jgi:hypothetical protein